jgi:hypothetical protein
LDKGKRRRKKAEKRPAPRNEILPFLMRGVLKSFDRMGAAPFERNGSKMGKNVNGSRCHEMEIWMCACALRAEEKRGIIGKKIFWEP